MNVDRIYLLDKGVIIAEGTHTELYKTSKAYKEMVDLQHDGFIDEEEET
jgi:ABC-type multidrug transport system fused ATPase/permease subunit